METDKRQILETDNEEIYFLSQRTETVKPNLPLFFDTHPFSLMVLKNLQEN